MKNNRWVKKKMGAFEHQFRGLDEGMWPVRAWIHTALFAAIRKGRDDNAAPTDTPVAGEK